MSDVRLDAAQQERPIGRATAAVDFAHRHRFDRIAEPGPYEVDWNGQVRDGSPASPGVYFYRLESSGRELTGRMALVK